jgi:hypothetical protein
MRNLTAEIQLAKNVPDEDYELVLAAQLEPALFLCGLSLLTGGLSRSY